MNCKYCYSRDTIMLHSNPDYYKCYACGEYWCDKDNKANSHSDSNDNGMEPSCQNNGRSAKNN